MGVDPRTGTDATPISSATDAVAEPTPFAGGAAFTPDRRADHRVVEVIREAEEDTGEGRRSRY
jgi:hypothetical protein